MQGCLRAECWTATGAADGLPLANDPRGPKVMYSGSIVDVVLKICYTRHAIPVNIQAQQQDAACHVPHQPATTHQAQLALP